MTLRFYDGGSFKILAAKPLVHWLFLLACLIFRALLLLPFAVDMDSYLVLAATNLTSTSMTVTTWAPTAGPSQCMKEEEDQDPCGMLFTEDTLSAENICNETWRTHNKFSLSRNLKFCEWRTFKSLGSDFYGGCFNQSHEDCSQCLRDLLKKDDSLRDMYEDYASILKRFDCKKSYSMWNCTRCQEKYKDWLCATQLPYFNEEGRRVRACLENCRQARKTCPYLLPHKQYCGQQSFLCPEERDLQFENATYAKRTPALECLGCVDGAGEKNWSMPCAAEYVIPGGGAPHGGATSIHSIPLVVASVCSLGCLVALIAVRTLCGRWLT